jgi:hypothetical protein
MRNAQQVVEDSKRYEIPVLSIVMVDEEVVKELGSCEEGGEGRRRERYDSMVQVAY